VPLLRACVRACVCARPPPPCADDGATGMHVGDGDGDDDYDEEEFEVEDEDADAEAAS